ncbi:Myosin-2 [Venturia nashicola]|uniref:Myosin-2 n=1 Tax=Venturia nashicola TaxID=86259 RepID=A0A4Z1PBR3_9PEZI|nr:Myosin-2 [Venturia nashicola]TLD35449.1 Myosin-2 [Venturia nashicola]
MIARRSFQAEQVAIEHIDREITISPSTSQDKTKSSTTTQSPPPPSQVPNNHTNSTSPPRGRAPCRGEQGFEEPSSSISPTQKAGGGSGSGNVDGQHVKWKGEGAKEAQERRERKDSAQEIIAKEEEVGKRNMMERLKDIVEVRKEEVRRNESV